MAEEIKKYDKISDLPKEDGLVRLEPKSLVSNDFEKESDVTDYIVLNIEKFCEQVLGDKLVSFEQEYVISESEVYHNKAKAYLDKKYYYPRSRRVDLLIRGEKKSYLVEIKKPFNLAENRYAIGQLLDYGREFLDSEKQLVLLTTKYDINTAKTIEYYELPIRYIYFDKKRHLEKISG